MYSEELLMSTSESNCAINLWDWKTSNLVFHYKKNGGPISPNFLEKLGNDYIIGGNSKVPKLFLWQVNSHDPIKKFRLILPDIASCLAVCPNSCYLASGIKTDLYIWQLSSGKLLTIQKKNYQPITVIKFSSCGNYILVGGQDGLLNVYKLVDLISLDKSFLAQSIVGQTEPMYMKHHHNHPITSIHVGNFGMNSRFATSSIDQTVKIYELLSGELLLNLYFDNPVHSVVFDSACWKLFVGCSNGILKMFSLTGPQTNSNYNAMSEENGQKEFFKGHEKSVKCLCLNISENILSSGADDGFIIIWEIASRQVLKKIAQNSPITNLRFITNHNNIHIQNFKITTPVTDLDMELNLDKNFGVKIIQCTDIEDPGEKFMQQQILKKQQYQSENLDLRARNQQLFQYCLQSLQMNKT
ncbi:hypothetical protein WA026_011164 [Henosepilachna vigintioctopunctata]|uniref:Uncharacterized protein n=1 Tax=Henosepilachna vigintioctopunctata TaxID=420089 RepID=A0AAW1U5Z1_9CUCU